MPRISRRFAFSVAIIVLFLVLDEIRRPLRRLDWFANLYDVYPSAMPTTLWKGAQVLLVVLALMAVRRRGVGFALSELGLRASPLVGFGAAFIATLPALVLLIVAGALQPDILTWALLMTAVASPLSEEMLYRGFLFGQLYRAAQWPFAAAVLINMVPFAWGHLYQSDGSLFETAGVLTVIGIGAVFYAWLYVRWDYNLWVVIAHHALMNGYFHVFEVGDSVVDNVASFSAVLLGALGMLLFTLYMTPPKRRSSITPDPQIAAPEAAPATE